MGHDPWERKTPPEEEEDWAFIWRASHRAHEGWIVVGPIVAAVRNWKAWVFAAAAFVYLNRPDILAALQSIVGGQ